MGKAAWRIPPEPISEERIEQTYEADVVIVGAGHSGVAAARACAEAGLSVRVIETMVEKNYWAYGIDFGHINSDFLRSKGVPPVDEIEFFNDWQLRSGNRSNPRLVMQFVRNCGSCFDWFLEALSPEQRDNVQIRYWPAPKRYSNNICGIKTWIGTATFPEALWHDKGITDAVVANIQRAKEHGAQFHFSTVAEQLEKQDGRVTAVIAKERHGGYLRYRARKGVVLAAGDFARNEEMMKELCDELVTLAPSEAHRITGLSRDGSGIRMGVWAGGRMVPGPIACMGGNTAAPNSPLFQATATLWLDGENKRFCNEGFGDSEFSGLEAARIKTPRLVNLFDNKVDDILQRQPPIHGSLWVNNPDDPRMATAAEYIAGAQKAGKDGYAIKDPHAPKGVESPRLYAAATLEELADILGFRGQLKQNLLDSVARYNAFCRSGRDEDFGKDPSLLVPLDTAPYYAMVTDRTEGGAMGPMVTVDGLWTDDHQQVYDQQLDVIPGLFATGNCCGRRFGVQYSTPVAGVSIGIAWTLGRELGKYLATL